MKTHTIPAVLILALGTLFTSAKLQSQVIYSDNFLNEGETNIDLFTYGWSGYFGTSASSLTSANGRVSFLAGNPNTEDGFLTFSGLNTSYGAIDTFSAIDAAGSEITWSMGNNQTAITVRLLVQSGSSWYASDEVFSNATTYTLAGFQTAETADVRRSLTFSTAAENWRSFTLTPGPGGEMSLGGVAVSDLSSEITGIGFYAVTTSTSDIVRLDSLVITGTIPEPSTYAVLLGAGALFVVGCRRKRS